LNTYRKIRDENVFPIRFLWLFELKEQVMSGVAMPLSRSHYNEVLLTNCLRCLEDESLRQKLIEDDVLFDLDNKAISLTQGWVLLGDPFAVNLIDDLMEIEAFYGEELMVPHEETGIASPMFVDYKSKKKEKNGAIRAVRYESKRKPKKCPACSSHRIAEIIYGMPEFSAKLEKDDVLFDLDNKAISMKRGWVLIGDTFIDDLMEIEAFYGEQLMVPHKETRIASPMFAHYKTKKKWQNGAIIAVRCESKRKPKKCPACSSHRIANILYGMPEYSTKLEKDLNSGRIILGGCCITNDDPKWQCADCQMVIYLKSSSPG
jgi:hypothetical protein